MTICNICGDKFSCRIRDNNRIIIDSRNRSKCWNCSPYTGKKKFTVSNFCNCGHPRLPSFTQCAMCKNNCGDFANRTLESVQRKNNAHRFGSVREHARRIYKDIKFCENCGYDKHVEVCHIKPISKFTLDTLLSEINSRDNIKILCPNCHWELDNGYLKKL